MKPLDLLIDEWLHDKGYDLAATNPIHAQALRAHAKAEVIRSLAEKPVSIDGRKIPLISTQKPEAGAK